MIRVDRMTDYALVVLAELRRTGGCETSTALAAATGVPEAAAARVLKSLSGAGLVASSRGRSGGYRAAEGVGGRTVLDVVEALEGRIALAPCAEDGGECRAEATCPSKGGWNQISEAVRAALAGTTVDGFAGVAGAPARCGGCACS